MLSLSLKIESSSFTIHFDRFQKPTLYRSPWFTTRSPMTTTTGSVQVEHFGEWLRFWQLSQLLFQNGYLEKKVVAALLQAWLHKGQMQLWCRTRSKLVLSLLSRCRWNPWHLLRLRLLRQRTEGGGCWCYRCYRGLCRPCRCLYCSKWTKCFPTTFASVMSSIGFSFLAALSFKATLLWRWIRIFSSFFWMCLVNDQWRRKKSKYILTLQFLNRIFMNLWENFRPKWHCCAGRWRVHILRKLRAAAEVVCCAHENSWISRKVKGALDFFITSLLTYQARPEERWKIFDSPSKQSSFEREGGGKWWSYRRQ